MQSVLIVCGAGASSTFLASRMRALAKARGLAIAVSAASDSDLPSLLPSASVLLVGPHLESSFAALKADAAAVDIPAALLPSTAFGPEGAQQALDLVDTLVSLEPAPTTSAGSN